MLAIIDAPDRINCSSTEDIALAAIKNIVKNASVVMELKSAVDMFKLVQLLVKHTNDTDAYEHYVGKWSSLIQVTRKFIFIYPFFNSIFFQQLKYVRISSRGFGTIKVAAKSAEPNAMFI